MDKLKLRGVNECIEGFSAPKSPRQVVERLRVNLTYFLTNYILVLVFAFILASALGRIMLVSAGGAAVLAHAVLKNPNIGAKIKDAFEVGVGGPVKNIFKK